MPTQEQINPAVLQWARVTAGLSLDDAARRLGLTSGPRGTAEEKLAAIEAGEKAATDTQIAKMAAVYHRPLIALYLAEPPREANGYEDFRTTTAAVATDEAARLGALVRDVRVRQSILRELVEADEGAVPRGFVGSVPISTPIPAAVAKIRQLLDLPQGASRPKANVDLFSDLRERVEAAGVFVLLLGDLGSWQTAIPASVFRGFAVADDLAPLIVINDQDAKPAWSFTLIHEFAHILVGSTGISGAPTTHNPATPKERVERFCNDVAGETLLPAEALTTLDRLTDLDDLLDEATEIAAAWGVSQAMAAYRLWRVGRADADTYGQAVRVFADRWTKQRKQKREQRQDDEGGPNFYVVRRHRLGSAIVETVGQGLRAEAITHSTAAKVFGVKPGAVEALLSTAGGPRRQAG